MGYFYSTQAINGYNGGCLDKIHNLLVICPDFCAGHFQQLHVFQALILVLFSKYAVYVHVPTGMEAL